MKLLQFKTLNYHLSLNQPFSNSPNIEQHKNPITDPIKNRTEPNRINEPSQAGLKETLSLRGTDGGGGAEEAGLLELKFVELLLAVHLDDERDDEHEERGAGDPGGLSGAPEELLRHEGGVAGGLLAAGDDG